jgi:hypothetical protein
MQSVHTYAGLVKDTDIGSMCQNDNESDDLRQFSAPSEVLLEDMEAQWALGKSFESLDVLLDVVFWSWRPW